jgi:error-prone DNA polymerase
MPAEEFPKLRPHPIRQSAESVAMRGVIEHTGPEYAELCVTTNYTFLTGASHPEELVAQAASLGYRAVGIADLHTVAGIVRAHVAAKAAGIQLVIGARLRLVNVKSCDVLVCPTDMPAYRRMCRLLTIGKRRVAKGECRLSVADLADHAKGLIAIAVPQDVNDGTITSDLLRLRGVFDDGSLSLAACVRRRADDGEWLPRLASLSAETAVPLVATNDVQYHMPERRMLHDVLTCIRHACTLAQAGLRLDESSARHLLPRDEIGRLFAAYPKAITRGVELAQRASGFSLDQLRYEYPDEVVPTGRKPQEHLAELTWSSAERVFDGMIPAQVRAQIDHELRLIDELNYAPYFLTVHDLVRFARTGEQLPGNPPLKDWPGPILCQGRGAAANSAVCFCLGVTAVDPTRINLLFERFVSKERNEPPDIDIDFEHERREEVIQYIYRKYGRERAALTAEVITYRRRSAIRDVGKALGLSLDLVDRLAKSIDWFDNGVLQPDQLRELGLNPSDTTLLWLARLTNEILGFPRHLSQHVGGFVITRSPLCELVPVENAAMPDRTVIEWDKDDLDAVGMLKVDVLGLGMLTALRRCMDMVNQTRASPITLATIPAEDPATYEMIQRADTVGVFQIESRAQMSMLPRLRPATFYDLVIEVAIVRPGPIQGGMVHPYLRRRQGLETVEALPDTVPEHVRRGVQEVLGKTLGVPLFQEQCMALAVKAAGFSAGKADQLRRAMAAWKRKGDQIYRFGQQLIDGMLANGIPEAFARRCFEQIKGFSEYGFPESHAASFALLVYASAWLKRHHPAEFCAALLNSQPMGFYAPAQLVRDAKEHDVHVLPIDVNHSRWDCTIERGSLRLGMRLARGVGMPDANRIVQTVERVGRFDTLRRLWLASGTSATAMRRLAVADAFGSMGLSRQQALWQARLLREEPMPLFDQLGRADAQDTEAGLDALPTPMPMTLVQQDYEATGLSLRAHPMSFVREMLQAKGVRICGDLRDPSRTAEGELVLIAGLVLVKQRPGTANDVTFITIEDESGSANLIVWKRVYQRFRRIAATGWLIATGHVQRQQSVSHLIVTRMTAIAEAPRDLRTQVRSFR